jgi:hypothetical protein
MHGGIVPDLVSGNSTYVPGTSPSGWRLEQFGEIILSVQRVGLSRRHSSAAVTSVYLLDETGCFFTSGPTGPNQTDNLSPPHTSYPVANQTVPLHRSIYQTKMQIWTKPPQV